MAVEEIDKSYTSMNSIIHGIYVDNVHVDNDHNRCVVSFVDMSGQVGLGAIVIDQIMKIYWEVNDPMEFTPNFSFLDLWVKESDGCYMVCMVFFSFELFIECGSHPVWEDVSH